VSFRTGEAVEGNNRNSPGALSTETPFVWFFESGEEFRFRRRREEGDTRVYCMNSERDEIIVLVFFLGFVVVIRVFFFVSLEGDKPLVSSPKDEALFASPTVRILVRDFGKGNQG